MTTPPASHPPYNGRERQIINDAIAKWKPAAIISLYSGGYDSLCATHLLHRMDLELPLFVYSIDTRLSADGWRDYVCDTAASFGWRHDIYDNLSGFNEFVKWVELNGSPYSQEGHKRAYNRLKGRAIDAMLRDHKPTYHDRVLFVSGIRQAESSARRKLINPVQRMGDSNAIFANPLFYWTDMDVLNYRIDNELPDNPFYNTVKGSGDCQCNWGRFISMEKLRKHSPNLAAGNVAIIDKISRECHGYGWDGRPEGQTEMALDLENNGQLIPFLCQSCSRAKPRAQAIAEEVYLQRGLLFTEHTTS